MNRYRYIGLLVVLLVAGCQSLPGLRVLSGEDGGDIASDSAAQNVDLIMADKTGDVNASLIAAADRLEAAAGNVDVVEVREDLLNDTFLIYMILQLQGDQVQQIDSLRRAVELTWQAMLQESQRSGLIRIEVLSPQVVTTLDNGLSSVGFTQLVMQIERADAINYLAHPHNLDTFQQLVIDGKMSFDTQSQSLYTGQPNHPTFMLPGGG